MAAETLHVEEHRVRGENLVTRVRELVKAGNARRIIVKNDAGAVIIEVPLTVGLVGAVLEPTWAALGAIAALAAHCRIVVESTPVSFGTAAGPPGAAAHFRDRGDIC